MAIFTGRARKKRANASTSLVAHSAVPAEFHTHSMHVPSYTMTNEHGQRAVLVGGVLQFELLPDGDHGHMRDNAPKKRSRKKAMVIGPETSRLLADAMNPRPSIGPETSRLLALAAASHQPSTGLGTAAAKRPSKKAATRRSKKADTHAAISKLLEFDASAIRENASFTLDQDFGSGKGGKGDTAMLGEFYHQLQRLYPGKTPIPIPPEHRVHPTGNGYKQLFVFATFAIRKLAPIAVKPVDEYLARTLERCPPVEDFTNVEAGPVGDVFAQLDRIHEVRSQRHDEASTRLENQATLEFLRQADTAVSAVECALVIASLADPYRAAQNAADLAKFAASVDPDATWAAVNEMLKAL